MKFWLFYLLLLLTGKGVTSYAGPLEIMSPQVQGQLIGKDLRLYEDPDNRLTIEDLAKLPDAAFFEVPKIVPAFGATSSAYWARIDLVNRLDQELNIFLEYTYPLADNVDFYLPDGKGSWKHIAAGDRQYHSTETYRHRLPMASTQLAPQSTQQVFIKVHNQGLTQFPIRIWTEREFHDNRAIELSLTSSLVFVMAMMLIYNALLYVTTREHILAVYVVFLFFNVTCQLAPTGLLRMGPFNDLAIYLSNAGYLLNINLSFFLITIISMSFLEIPVRHGRLRYLVFAGFAFSFAGIAANWASYALAAQIAITNGFLNSAILFSLTLISVIQGNRSAKYLLMAWTGMIICIMLNQLYWFALVTNQYFAFGSLIGTATEVVLISLAIGHKMRMQIQSALRENERINKEILEKEQARTVFFHNTSHELRTPLNGMIGFLHLILKGQYGNVNDSISVQLGKTLRLAESLKNQVNTILDLARMKRGEMKLQNTHFSLNELKRNLDDLAEGLRLRYPNARYQSDLMLENGSDVATQDYEKLFAICRNLLGNAFKFSQSDRANDVRLLLRSGKEGLTIEVRDSGIGIPKEYLTRIFDEFVQVQSDARRSHEGTGLGLSMVRDFVRLMQGNIQVESLPDQGSTFSVSLPPGGDIQVTSQPAQLPPPTEWSSAPTPVDSRTEERESRPEGASAFILVVDDNDINREVIADLLDYRGYRSMQARGGREALELLQKHSFDLILLDIMMPEVSGEDVLQRMRQDPQLKDIPVILLTARASDEDRIHGLNLGADDYISKPIIAEELLLRVGNLLRRVDEARSKTLEESQEKYRQLGELFAYTSHEIKNIYNYIDDNTKITFSEFVTMLSPLPIPEADIQSMATALLAEEKEASLQACLEALPKVPRDQTILRSLRTSLASLQMPLDKVPGVWQSVANLSAEERSYLDIILRWALNSLHLYSTVFRSRDIFQATLAFVHLNTEPECELKRALDPIITLQSIRAKRDAIRLDITIPRLTLQVESGALQQIILNLLGNAMDAVNSLPPAERWVKLWVDLDPGSGTVQIKVSNAGAPLAENTKAQLFKRGFTTKGSKGNGIGLYLSRKLAQKNRGELQLDPTHPTPCFVLVLKASKSLREGRETWPRVG